MTMPYGVGDNEKINANTNNQTGKKTEEAQAKRYDLNVSFRGMDSTPKLQELYDKMREIENRVIDEAFENRQVWLRDDYDGVKAFVAKLFTPIVKHDKNKETGKIENKYPPTMKIKVPYDEKTDTFNFECSDMDGADLDFKSCMAKLKGAKAKLIIQFGGIWFAGGRYGCSWRIIRAKFEVMHLSSKVDFIADSDDENDTTKKIEYDEDVDEDALENVDKVTPPKAILPPPTKPTGGKPVTIVDESEEDDDDEEGEDSSPAPPPPPPTKASKAAAKAPPPPPPEDDDEEEEEEDDEDDEPEPPPPPPPPAKTTRKKTTKA
jgi:hypothetical protein